MSYIEAIEFATPSQRASWQAHKERRARMRSVYVDPDSRPRLVFEREPPASSQSEKVYRHIRDIVAAHFGIFPALIEDSARNPKYVLPRHILVFLLREHAGMTLMEIGKFTGGRDHSTVSKSLTRTKTEMQANESLRETLATMAGRITAEVNK